MINRPTVVVVGAGGSAPLGFPLGFNFTQQVANAAMSRLAPELDREHGGEDFRRELLASGRQSVDAFLEHRREYIAIGKLAIAATLIPFEDPSKFHGVRDRPNWYDYLFDRMNTSRDDLRRNRLSIVTFNYDRSLDYYLRESVQNSYGCSTESATELLSTIPIVHVHGKLGTLEERPFRPDTATPRLIQLAAAGIRVVHEAGDDAPEFTQARQLLSQAERIYFVGFGFHVANLNRLYPRGGLSAKQSIFASALGLTNAERQTAQRRLGGSVQFGDVDDDALQFLREMPALDD